MFDFFCCRMPCLVKSCAVRTVVVVSVVCLILWIVSLYTSDPATVTVPPISETAKRNAQNKMMYFGETVNNNSDDDDNTDDGIDRHSIVIVGGGAAGLFAGYTLKYLGIDDFVILEAHPSLYGGRVRQFLPSSSSNSSTSASASAGPWGRSRGRRGRCRAGGAGRCGCPARASRSSGPASPGYGRSRRAP